MNTEKAVARLTEVIRRKHLALATERSYCAWLRRYCDNLKKFPTQLSSEQKLERFLNALAQENVAGAPKIKPFARLTLEGVWRCLNSIVVASERCADFEPQARHYTKLRHCKNQGGVVICGWVENQRSKDARSAVGALRTAALL